MKLGNSNTATLDLKTKNSDTDKELKRRQRQRLIKDIINQRWLYVMILPAIILLILFNYAPMYGAIIAFKDYNPLHGIMGSEWVGLEYFEKSFDSPFFTRAFFNTLIISLMNIVLGFPMPIIFALFLNEIKGNHFKRAIQTISYMPHFLSWVIIGSFVVSILSPTQGLLKMVIEFFGVDFDTLILADPDYFRWILVISNIWKGVGWGSIVYLATLTTIDQELYEAASIDGAGRFKKMLHISIPGLLPTIVTLFILNIGGILNSNFEQIFILYSPSVYEVGDVISTYVYREGIGKGNYSYTTAIGLFRSVIGLVLVLGTNAISRKFGRSMW